MSIQSRIQQEMVAALKARDQARRSAISFVAAEIKRLAIDKRLPELPDPEAVAVLQKQLKLRHEALAQARTANRPDLIEAAEYEIRLIGEFLPKGLSEDETRALATKVVQDLKATTMKDMGKVMAEAASREPAVDRAVLSGIVKGMLAAK